MLNATQLMALPVDWHGKFGLQSTMINDYRRLTATSEVSASNDGSQEVKLSSGNKDSLSFQSYIFKLSPDIIINDSATMHAEFSTGYANGGFLGDSATTAKSGSLQNGSPALYAQNRAGSNGLNVQKVFLELNSDTATYHIGRHTYHWGLGALYNEGSQALDRHAYSRDGVTMFFKFNNFHITPFWSVPSIVGTNSQPNLTRSADAKDYGLSFLYDNKDKDIAMGVQYSIKNSGAFNGVYVSNVETANTYMGKSQIKVLDLYFKKIFGNFDFSIEAPLISGDLGHLVNNSSTATANSKAILFQSNYVHSDSLSFGFDMGYVSGQDSDKSKFKASYLNPNFQIANLLFKYNLNAVGDSSQNIYDSYLTNTQYFKVRAKYLSDKWTLDGAIIVANALEAATSGQVAFNHQKMKFFNATKTQEKNLGTEFDFNASYKWNKEVSLVGSLGYLMTGKYFAYTNTASDNTVKNSLSLEGGIVLDF